jgi:serine/threonine-protein kinase
MADQPPPNPATRSDSLLPSTGTRHEVRTDDASANGPGGTLGDAELPSPSTLSPCTAAAPAARRILGRYEVADRIGRGGMGEVLRARDPDLNRELAVKVLLEKHHGRREVLQRFLEEAQVGGQLQHPGVVPVYELGRSADGLPYFTMKLVQGRTLADLLKERSSNSHDLPRFLQIFEQVCQTVAYAHSRGVLHRDLKPANIMVGGFGEVQVMDWGLAKVLGRDDSAAALAENAESLHTVRSDDAAEGSQAGTVVGTPAYMAPEQAQGETADVDRRADVFGLGAILCEILTGAPPYGPGPDWAVLLQAAAGELENALTRLDGCGADAELIALAKTCLAVEREKRPRDAGEAAAVAATYRTAVQERLRQAELARAAAQAKAAEARKRQRLTVALAAAVVAALALAGGGTWYVRQQQIERQAEQVAEVKAALDDAERRKDDPKPELAWAALERAEARLAGGSAETLRSRCVHVRGALEKRRKDRQMLAKLEEARLRPLAHKANSSHFDHKGSDELYSKAFVWYSLDVEQQRPAEAAAALRASALAAELLDALDDWARVVNHLDRTREKHLRAVANAADANAWRRRLRQATASEDLAEIKRLAAGPLPEGLSASTVMLLNDALSIAKQPIRGLGALRDAQRRKPGDFWLTFALAYACHAAGPDTREEAVRYYTAALALRPESTFVHLNLGVVLADQNKLAEAVAEYKESLRLKPDFPDAHVNLGNALAAQNKLAEAVAEYKEALRLKPDYPLAHCNLGAALKDQNKLEEAVAEYKEALRLKPDYPDAHVNLGNALAAQNKLAEAVAEYKEALRLQPDFPLAHINLGNTLMRQGKFTEALDAVRRGHELGSKTRGWRHPSALWVRQAERRVELDAQLPAFLQGDAKPTDAVEQIELAQVCKFKRWHAAAARFCAEAFSAKPDLASDLNAGHRYNAALVAALAGCGRGEDAAKPDAAEQARLRRQALAWLRDDLVAWSNIADRGKPAEKTLVKQKMEHWRSDADLAGIRDKEALDKLPDDERKDWQKLWADVAALLAKTSPKE